MKEIQGQAKNIRELLGRAKFSIDFYQREYRWEKKQVGELLDDLAGKFLDDHREGDDRRAVKNYGRYFLGSIIISDKGEHKFIIDGQQRLTSLTLLLIYIYSQIEDDEENATLASLIYSRQFGERSFNLNVEERAACMDALFTGEVFDESDQPPSVVNILQRYRDIQEIFPSELTGDALPFFADWLMENVYLVEITAYSDADAYTIFETMNDRGLSLTPTDMLKGYLLANINDTSQRSTANELWRDRVSSLQNLGKDEAADAIKSWLRSQHAKTIRERKKGAVPQDFDLIGTEFHRWVRDNRTRLNLRKSADFYGLIMDDFNFYSRWYQRIRGAAIDLTPGLEAIYYNTQNNFTLQFPVLLAPLQRSDSEENNLRKLRVVASYIDTLIARRIWNYKSTDYSTMQYNMFSVVIMHIRGKSPAELAELLAKRLEDEGLSFASDEPFRLHQMNGPHIHRLLARMTDWVETRSGRASHYDEYTKRSGKGSYELEHIWADHYERHTDEFGHAADFEAYRNRIGGLLLLPKRSNASYGDLPYVDKREYYYSQNLLAQSLHEAAYERDPGFRDLVTDTGLPFRPHAEFKKADLDARQKLYQALAELVWSPENLQKAAES